METIGIGPLDFIILDQGVRQQLLAHLIELRRVLHLELDQAAHMHARDALEAQGRQRPLDGLALRVEDPRLRPDQDPCLQELAPLRSSQRSNGSSVMRS